MGILSLKDSLLLLGFTKLPSFDSEYFRYRKAMGYLVLVNTTTKQYYSVFTIDAVTCINQAISMIKGDYAERAKDFPTALQMSSIMDWELYFNANCVDTSLKTPVRVLLEDYSALTTGKSKLDPAKPCWAYIVTYNTFKRTFFISDDKELDDPGAIGKFLRKWRESLESALNRGSIQLKQYYAECSTHSIALNQWMRDDMSGFTVQSVDSIAGQPRSTVVDYVTRSNKSLSIKHRIKAEFVSQPKVWNSEHD